MQDIMGFVSISSFAGCRKQLRLFEVVAICVLIVWFFMAIVDEAIYRNTGDEVPISQRFFESGDGSNGGKMRYNFSCYNNDDVLSRELFPADLLEERSCQQRLPTVLVTGVKYCKTDVLTSLLRHHPYLVFPKTADVSYFSDYFDLGKSWYQKQMGFTVMGQQTADSSPTYFTHPEVPRRVKAELTNNTKFIVLFCDPVVRALREARDLEETHHQLSRDMDIIRTEVRNPVKGALAPKEGRQDNAWLLESSIWANKNSQIVQDGLYINFFKRWYGHFPANSFFMLGEERLLNDTESALRKIEAFLGLPPYFKSKVFHDPFHDYVCTRNNFAGFDPYCFSKKSSLTLNPAARSHDRSDIDNIKHLDDLRKFYRPYNERLQRMFLVPVL